MYIDYLLLGLVSIATLIWAFYTLPEDDAPTDNDSDGGTRVGGDTYPTDAPPGIVKEEDTDGREVSPSAPSGA